MTNLLRLVLLVIVCFGAWPADAADSTMGPLTKFLIEGTKEGWEGNLTPEAYRLENKGSAQAAQYFHVDPHADGTALWAMSVELKFDASAGNGVATQNPSLAGVVFGFKANPRSYLALLMDGTGKLSVYKRTQNGLQHLVDFGGPPLDTKRYNELRIVETQDKFEAYANGKHLGGIGTKAGISGGMGIIAGGPGAFLFRKFQLAPSS